MTDESPSPNGADRRTFLRATGAAVAGAALATSAVSARGPAASDVHVATADFDRGVSGKHRHEVRQTALREFNACGGDLDAPPARSTPDPEDGTVVSFAYRIDENGVPQQYAGIAGDADSVSTLHGRATARAGAFERGLGTGARTDGVRTQAGSWNRILHDEADFCKDPYGCVTNNFDLQQLASDGDAAQDAYAVKHIFAMEPGVQKYGSDWVNNVGRPMHDWRQNSMGGADLHEWDPLGTHDGKQTISVSVGTGGASLGWQYTLPAVTTVDESSPSSNYAKWSEEFNTDAARENTNGMKPGSSTWLDQQAAGSGYHDLMDLVADGEFYDGGWSSDTYSLKHTFHVDVYY
ncbi:MULTISPECIES: hypothetical protein [Halorussus]|uniref:hypothetical protein n=1 Tax=Halorussus TaxID=1070314 RepID=UPI00209FD1AB|nr:hypothetical protein [Halorussus vallis]USZ75342.1 hypothetical protein NGM07_18150 [Halorussus vallis]